MVMATLCSSPMAYVQILELYLSTDNLPVSQMMEKKFGLSTIVAGLSAEEIVEQHPTGHVEVDKLMLAELRNRSSELKTFVSA